MIQLAIFKELLQPPSHDHRRTMIRRGGRSALAAATLAPGKEEPQG